MPVEMNRISFSFPADIIVNDVVALKDDNKAIGENTGSP